MQIPMIKTLLKFRHYPDEKNVLCDYLVENDDKFGAIDLQMNVYNRNPFEFYDDDDIQSEIYYRHADGTYAIVYHDRKGNQVRLIDVFVIHVLEFKGKIFELKETSYDMKEYDY